MGRAASRGVSVRCPTCLDSGHVCENHPDHVWFGLAPEINERTGETIEECCGGAGMPCPVCCSSIPEDGRHSIVEAFVPDCLRAP